MNFEKFKWNIQTVINHTNLAENGINGKYQLYGVIYKENNFIYGVPG